MKKLQSTCKVFGIMGLIQEKQRLNIVNIKTRDLITKLDYYWNNWVGYRGVSEVILEVQSTVV